jgi:hypothetical protein
MTVAEPVVELRDYQLEAIEMPNGPNYYGKVGKVEKVWNKVMAISGFDASAYRVDAAHHLIARSQYGTDCPLRWEIDHKTQKSHGGSDYITNLQPLNTATSRSFGNRAGKPC